MQRGGRGTTAGTAQAAWVGLPDANHGCCRLLPCRCLPQIKIKEAEELEKQVGGVGGMRLETATASVVKAGRRRLAAPSTFAAAPVCPLASLHLQRRSAGMQQLLDDAVAPLCRPSLTAV